MMHLHKKTNGFPNSALEVCATKNNCITKKEENEVGNAVQLLVKVNYDKKELKRCSLL